MYFISLGVKIEMKGDVFIPEITYFKNGIETFLAEMIENKDFPDIRVVIDKISEDMFLLSDNNWG